MRIAVVLGMLAALATAPYASAQGPGPKLGQIEVKAFQPIPKSKTAVQLTSDTALARNLRREVMVRLARRGNDVGFSGGNVMRMDVTYLDLLGSGDNDSRRTVIQGGNDYQGPGANPRPDLPAMKLERRDGISPRVSAPTLRITLTLYAVDTGKVMWVATASCAAPGGNAEQTGVAMIDSIFDEADKSRIADAGCPL